MRIPSRALATVAGVALLLSACGGGDSSDSAASPGATESPGASATETGPPARGNADLVIWTDELKAPAVRPIAEQFGEDNGISVEVQVISTNLQSQFVTANAAGNGPDVFLGAHDWIGNLVQNGAIEPLQITAADLGGYAPIAVKATTYDGKLYALPYGVEALALYRNTEFAPTAPATLDQAFQVGQAAKDAGKVESAFNLQVGDNGDAYHMEPIYTSMGGYLFGTLPNGDYNPQDLGVGKPGSLAAAQKIYSLGEKGSGILRRSINADNSIALFAAGKAAFLVSGPWALTDIKKGGIKYAIQPIPGFAGQKPAQPFAGVQGIYIASKAKNPAFAQEFVTTAMNTPESMQAMYEGTLLPPAMTSVQQTAAAADPNVGIFAQAAAGGAPMPAIPAMSAVWEPLGKAYAAIVGGADPTSTMTTAGQTIAGAIAKSG